MAIAGDTIEVGAVSEASSTTGVNSTPDVSTYAAGTAYVFNLEATTWTQQAYLKASNTGESHLFGDSVAVSLNTAVA